ncbi:ABC transporter substrate-binding protein [Candidatus Falkowbacteria bacterium]|nr:ABC transporter substrate-binding protein [Candidatus Falkowbacteria bacterium]
MSTGSKTIIWLIIAVVVIVGIWYGVSRKGPGEEDPIKIGTLLPLTGDLASYGLEAQKAFDMAIEEINNNGGIDGQLLEAIHEDSQCDPAAATTATQKLINIDEVKIIVGAACSGATLATAPITEAAEVILISPFSTSIDITNAGDFVFRTSPSDALVAKKTAELAYDTYGHTKAAVIAENTDFSQALKKSFSENFEEMGGEIVASEDYNTDDTDLKTQILKVKESGAEVVFFAPQSPTPGALLLKQAAELGLEARIIGNEFFGDKDLISAAQEAAEDVVYYIPGTSSDSPKTAKFYSDYQEKYGEEIAIVQYTPNVYDTVQLLADALKEHGEDTAKIRDYLYGIKNYEGVSGKFSFDENGDVDKDYTLMVIKDGEAVVSEE